MNRKIVKMISIIFIIFAVFCINTSVYAAKTKQGTGKSLNPTSSSTSGSSSSTQETGTVTRQTSGTGSGLTNQFNGNNGADTSKGELILEKVIGPILSVVRIVAVGISIIMITFLGIKYMAAAPTEKASIKNQLITFAIGAIVVVGATSILTLIKDFATGL